jgi:hypothetical protein
MICDLKAVEIILTFSIGGIGLRVAIAFLKTWLKLQGIGAVILSIVACLAASAVYLLIVHQFDPICLFIIATNVFAGSQVAFQTTK